MPIPDVALRLQRRVRNRALDTLAHHDGREGERLYVLEFAGPTPRVKIGKARSAAHLRERIATHLRSKNIHGYGLISAHVTRPIPHAAQAEDQALAWMGSAHTPIPGTREEFVRPGFPVHASFIIAVACADIAAERWAPNEDDDATPSFTWPCPRR